jgi:tetratricopeptide (TPR) repeat protein
MPMPYLRVLWLLCAAMLASWPQHARAQAERPSSAESTDRTDAEARARFNAGRLAFEAGRYHDALRDFLRAYELSGRPGLLYNVAATYARLDRPRDALDYFARYLAEVPDAPQRSEVEARMEALQAALDTEASQPAQTAPLPPVSPTDALNREPARWPFVLVGTGAALAVGGATLLGLALRAKNHVEHPPANSTWRELESDYARVKPWSMAGGLMLGVGGAALASGLLVHFVRASAREARTTVLVGPRSLVMWRSF